MKIKETHKEALKVRYAEPWRMYHSFSHIQRMLSGAESLFRNERITQEEYNSLERAIWYHDAIYNIPTKEIGSNEVLSYNLMLWDGYEDDLAKQCILATEHHFDGSEYDNPVVNMMMDLDIASFSDLYEEFSYTNKMIDLEYLAFNNPEKVHEGREKFLRSIIDQGSFTFRSGNEIQARNQIAYDNLYRYIEENYGSLS